jgi:hypothetical protein
MVEAANPMACAHCPWRLSNQGKRHPHGWYSKVNLRGLWAKLRRGERMTCHPTDPTNPVPEGHREVAPGTVIHECTGGLILQHREVMRLTAACRSADETGGDGFRLYRERHPRGLSREGAAELVSRYLFGGLQGSKVMTRPDLMDPDVGYPPLGEWRRP